MSYEHIENIKISEREKEILTYQKAWDLGDEEDRAILFKKLLQKIYRLEDEIESLKTTSWHQENDKLKI